MIPILLLLRIICHTNRESGGLEKKPVASNSSEQTEFDLFSFKALEVLTPDLIFAIKERQHLNIYIIRQHILISKSTF